MHLVMATKSSPTRIKVKKEMCGDEIKDFAETAMNELLGWYGYDSVDRVDITKDSRLNKIVLAKRQQQLQQQQQQLQAQQQLQHHSSNGLHMALGESSTSEKDSSRESSKSPQLIADVDKQEDTDCTWCRRAIQQGSSEVLKTPEGTIFCSESCFSQSRRASFKRAKTCDWCRHIRHAVSYVDFQDGISQLQFCSDKCLNQYKMQIFCKETQAHLDMNPHLKEKGSTSGGLITPDLWMKNCRSRSLSPASDQDRARSISPASSITPSQLSASISSMGAANSNQPPKPYISVAPPSKLMLRSMQESTVRQLSNRNAKKKRSSSRVQTPINNSSNTISVTQILNNNNNNSNAVLNNNYNSSSNVNNNSSMNNIKNCTVTRAQDLRTHYQPPPPPVPSQPPPPLLTHAQPQMHENIPRHNFPHPFLPPPPNLFPLRPQFFPRTTRYNIQPPPSPQMTAPEPPRLPPIRAPPPVTILVPYPIILPLPIPIPIPLPLIDFLKAAQLSGEPTNKTNGSASTDAPETSQASAPPNLADNKQFDSEVPLDFTTTKNTNQQGSSCTTNLSMQKQQKELSSHHVITKVPESVDLGNNLNTKDDDGEGACHEQRLPKFKITRLNSRRFLTKESECTRPLRKRKRIILADDVDPEDDDSRH